LIGRATRVAPVVYGDAKRRASTPEAILDRSGLDSGERTENLMATGMAWAATAHQCDSGETPGVRVDV